MLANVTYSSVYLAHKLHQHIASLSDADTQSKSIATLKKYINEKLVVPGLGILDATDKELSDVASNPVQAQDLLARMISTRAQIGWSTHGHSAVDVNIYSSGGAGTDAIRGNVENTDIGKFLRSYIGVDVADITKELQEKMERKSNDTKQTAAKLESTEQDYWVIRDDIERRLEEAGVTAF